MFKGYLSNQQKEELNRQLAISNAQPSIILANPKKLLDINLSTNIQNIPQYDLLKDKVVSLMKDKSTIQLQQLLSLIKNNDLDNELGVNFLSEILDELNESIPYNIQNLEIKMQLTKILMYLAVQKSS